MGQGGAATACPVLKSFNLPLFLPFLPVIVLACTELVFFISIIESYEDNEANTSIIQPIFNFQAASAKSPSTTNVSSGIRLLPVFVNFTALSDTALQLIQAGIFRGTRTVGSRGTGVLMPSSLSLFQWNLFKYR